MKYILWVFLSIILLLIISTVTARFFLERKVKAEVEELYKDVNLQKSEIINREDLKDLPACVQKCLQASGVIGQEKMRTARLKQKGLMRTKPRQAWMPFTAEQYFNIERPGFVWYANIQAAPFIHIAGRDKYYEGQGNMLIKIMSLFKVADGAGMEMDQGALVRYLAEIIWYPTAALNDYIQWEAIDDKSARAIMNYKGLSASGVFAFNQEGDVVSFSAKRYREQGGQFTMDDWYIPVREYNEFAGIRIPTKGEVIWKLPDGDFRWLQLEISEIEYNQI